MPSLCDFRSVRVWLQKSILSIIHFSPYFCQVNFLNFYLFSTKNQVDYEGKKQKKKKNQLDFVVRWRYLRKINWIYKRGEIWHRKGYN